VRWKKLKDKQKKEEAPMEWTYEGISKWFDDYFEDVRKSQGSLETVPNLGKYFTADMELMMYTAPAAPPRRLMTRDALLISFIHPDLQEDIVPRYYAIDVKQMIVAVQFEISFADKPSNTKWAPLQASAHYHLVTDESGKLKIKRIYYWTEALPADVFEIWARRREEALKKHALRFINASL
jgi:hypothetical protein